MKLLLLLSAALLSLVEANGPKNILFIMADDMRPEAEPFRGNWGWSVSPDDTLTPNLQKLAEKGTTFQNAYCQFSICGPSRTSLMTGRRPDTTLVYANDRYWRDYYDISTFPQYLKEEGSYTSVGLGKIFHEDYAEDGGYDAESWSDGYPFFAPPTKTFWKSKFGHDNSSVAIDENDYNSDLMDRTIADKAKEYLEQFADEGTLFFMAVGFKLPHLPWLAPSEFFNKFEGNLPDNCYVPNDLPESAFYESNELVEYHDMSSIGFNGAITGDCLNDEKTKELRRAYYASISYVDSLVGELLETLGETGLDKNTSIVFTSDHGYQLGEHKMWNKNTNVEIANHVPLIISDPDEEGGRSVDAPVELVDIFPTMVDLAGLDQIDLCDKDVEESRKEKACREGMSLVPLLRDSDDDWKKAVFYQYKRRNDMGYSVIKDNLRFTAWVHINSTSLEVNWAVHDVVYMELYNLADHPYENVNLVTDPDYASDVTALYEDVFKNGWSSYKTISLDNSVEN